MGRRTGGRDMRTPSAMPPRPGRTRGDGRRRHHRTGPAWRRPGHADDLLARVEAVELFVAGLLARHDMLARSLADLLTREAGP